MKKIFSRKNYLLLAAFIVLVVAGLGMSLRQLRTNIREPFTFYLTEDEEPSRLSSSQSESMRIIREKTRDTDKDGLSDYDERYVYKTSPFIEDTDSDGMDDKREIEAGSDPNCPKGQNCFSVEVGEDVDLVPDNQEFVDAQEERILSGAASVEEIRQLLKGAGISEEELSALSDEAILQLYSETLAGMEIVDTGLGTEVDGEEVSAEEMKAYVESLTNEEIISMLKESGVDESILETLTPPEIKQLVLDSLTTE